jgi:23S rRNA-intervening sequence protein
MAQTEHLPIYKAAYDLCLYFEQVVRNFPRYHKYSIGQDLRDGARRTLRLIVRANARRDKALVLLEIREEVEELKVLLRLCHDAKGFANFQSFEHAIGLVVNIARQNEGWLKSQQQGRGPTGAGQNRHVILKEVAEPSVP